MNWSLPGWFEESTFERTSRAWTNPDWVDVVVQSYRHRYAYAPGDPALDSIEAALAAQPAIPVPTVILHGDNDGVAGPSNPAELRHFTGPVRREIVPGVGHNMPQESPEPVIRAILELVTRTP